MRRAACKSRSPSTAVRSRGRRQSNGRTVSGCSAAFRTPHLPSAICDGEHRSLSQPGRVCCARTISHRRVCNCRRTRQAMPGAKFGGDPSTVMIFGHSAGASNVNSLTASPLAKGLFHRAVLQSGNSLSTRTALSDAEKIGAKFAEGLGAPNIAALRQKSAEEILKAPRSQMGANIDGWVLPTDAYSIFESGRQTDGPRIVGTVADDAPGAGTGPLKAADAQVAARTTYGELADRYLKLYPASTDAEATKSAHAFRTNNALANERAVARLQTKTGKSAVYWYYFTHVSPMPEGLVWGGRPAQAWGAYHGSELVYVFNAFPLQDWDWRPLDRQLGNTMSSMWVNFVKSGSPNAAGLPEWPKFAASSEMLMNLGDVPKAQPAPYRDALDFIDEWNAKQRSHR